MTFLAHTYTRTRMQTAVNWRQTPAFRPDACQDKERIILISAKSATSRTTTTMTRRPTKSKSKLHTCKTHSFFWLFPIRLTLTSKQKKGKEKTQWEKIHLARFPPISPIFSPLSCCIADHNCRHWRRRWKLFKLLPKYFGMTSMLANWRVTYISNTCWLRAAQVFALVPFFYDCLFARLMQMSPRKTRLQSEK